MRMMEGALTPTTMIATRMSRPLCRHFSSVGSKQCFWNEPPVCRRRHRPRQPRRRGVVGWVLVLFLHVLGGSLRVADGQGTSQQNGGSCLAMAGKDCVALIMDARFGSNTGLVNVQNRPCLVIGGSAGSGADAPQLPMVMALQGLQADVLTVEQQISQTLRRQHHEQSQVAIPQQQPQPQRHPTLTVSPRALASYTSHVLYQRKRAPYYVEPLIVGLEARQVFEEEAAAAEEAPDSSTTSSTRQEPRIAKTVYRPYICSMDLLGSMQEQPTRPPSWTVDESNHHNDQKDDNPEHVATFCGMGAAVSSLYGTAQAIWKPNMTESELKRAIVTAFASALERDCLSGYGARLYVLTATHGVTVYHVVNGRND